MGGSLFSPTHLVILLAVALLLFGAKRLPEIGRSLGVGMREFKDSVTGVQDATRLDTPAPNELPPPAVTAPAPEAAAPAPVAAPADPVVAEPQRETEQIS
jgi:sec-independent protein translocase protein TatA